MEIIALTVLFIVLPSYLVMFLYYKELFDSMDIIKITVLIGGVLAFSYAIQIFIFSVTHMVFTKIGRGFNEIIYFSLATLGIMIFLIIVARIYSDNFILAYLVMLAFSFIFEIIMSISFEWSERERIDKRQKR